MAAPYSINPTQGTPSDKHNNVIKVNTVTDSLASGNIAPGAKYIGFINKGNGSGGGTAVTIGYPGNLRQLYPGDSETFLALPGPSSTYNEVQWVAGSNILLITACY